MEEEAELEIIEKTCNLAVFLLIYKIFKYNHGHSILRLFVMLPNLLFTTSEKKRDYVRVRILRNQNRFRNSQNLIE